MKMNKIKLLTKALVGLILMLQATMMNAQNADLKIIGEGNGDLIKLGWLPKIWPQGMSGVKIQRKVNGGDWLLLTTDEIYPAAGLDKPLDNVESSSAEQDRLHQKMSDLIEQGKLKPNSREVYLDMILSDAKNLPMLAFVFATDYDIMLLNGFGFVDRGLKPGQNLEYGVFPVINSMMSAEPVATFEWTSGSKPDNALEIKSKIEIIGNKKSVLLKWEYDRDAFKVKQFKGFNIYQVIGEDKTKLNNSPVMVMSSDDPATLTRKISFPETEEKIKFIAVPVSYFETEGEPAVIEFNPAAYSGKISPPNLSAESIENVVLMTWSMEPDAEKSITGFEIHRKQEGGDYQVMAALTATERAYQDVSAGSGKYYFYRLIAIPAGGMAQVWSNEVVLQHVDKSLPEPPVNLYGEIVQENGVTFARLKWDYPEGGAPVTFRIFIDSPFGDLAHDSSIDPLTTNNYDFEIKKSRSDIYHFAVQAITENREKSALSNQVDVVSPSTSLPPISIWPIEKVDNDVVIYWDYGNDIADLAGFRVYNNGTLIADENTVDKQTKSYRARELESGNYRFAIEAVTQFGLVSKRSREMNMTVE